MRANKALRLPLQLGTSALYSLARGAAFAVPGIVLFTLGAAVLWFIRDAFDGGGDGLGYIVLILLGPGLIVSGFAYKHLRRAMRERPSDLVVMPDGIQIRGGPHHGHVLAWHEVGDVQLVQPEKSNELLKDDSDLRVMTIVTSAGKRLELAWAERRAEQVSLEELARTLRAATSGPTEEAVSPNKAKKSKKQKEHSAADHAGKVFECRGCSAAVSPDDRERVTCPYCGKETEVPEALRTQIRDARAVQARPDLAISKLLDQPRAGSVGALYVVAAMFMLVAWPTAALMMFAEYRLSVLSFGRVVCLVGFVATCIAGFYALIRGRLVDRQALRLVALDFAAIEPAKAGEPYCCQHCWAPLPERGADEVLVSCAYCAADNLLGLNLGRRASVARQERNSLTAALARRKLERRRWRGVTVAALVLLAAAWFALRVGVR